MGAGKTVWGKLLAETMSLRFVDLDEDIVAAEGLSIPVIFETKGEAYFRTLEAQLLRKTGEQQNLLVSCGGGTPCFFDNIQWMKRHGFVLWLHPPVAEIAERVWRVKHKRPLIAMAQDKEEAQHIIATLEAKRNSWYTQAHLEITDLVLDLPSLAQTIEQHWQKMETSVK